MEKILQQITADLRAIHPDSYYQMNPSNPVKYPYLTFDISLEELERNEVGVTLDVDLFGTGTSPLSVVQLEQSLKDALSFRREMTTDLSLRYNFQTSLTVPTLVPDLHRRNLVYYIKISERTKQYGTS